MKRLFLIIFAVFMFHPALAAEQTYAFYTAAAQKQFQTLTAELRCLVCQNQNIAESNASLAVDLRNQIYQQINAGKSNQEIIAYLVARYGNFILYKPPLEPATLALWFGPFLLLVFAVGYLLYYCKKR